VRSEASSEQTAWFCTHSFRCLVWRGPLYVFCINSTASLFCVARYRVDLLHALNCFVEQCREVICGSVSCTPLAQCLMYRGNVWIYFTYSTGSELNVSR
jgi:hypothetical protein